MILVIKLNKVKKFCAEIVRFLYSICIWKCIPTIRYEERAFDHLHLLLAYCIFLREILKVFKGNLKNVCQKAIKKPSHLSSQYIFPSSKCSKNLTTVKIKKKFFLKDVQISEYRFFMISNPDFSLSFPLITSTVYCWKYRFPTIFFRKSQNIVLKIFISRPPANIMPPPTPAPPPPFESLYHGFTKTWCKI